MSDVFISHVEEDADVALAIALRLEQAGFNTWCYELDNVVGVSYLLQTKQAIESSSAMVLVISAHSLGSSQITKEVVRAHESGKHFAPVLRDLSHAEFQARQPEWREAIGAAASIIVPTGGVAEILPRVVDGLRALGIRPKGRADAARLEALQRRLAEMATQSGPRVPPLSPVPEEPEPQPTLLGRAYDTIWRWGSRHVAWVVAASGILAATVLVAVVLSAGPLSRHGGDKAGATPSAAADASATRPSTMGTTNAAAATATPSAALGTEEEIFVPKDVLSSGLTAEVLGGGGGADVAVDSTGEPHVFYRGPDGGNVYVHKVGSTWRAKNRWGDDKIQLFEYFQMVLDKQDRVHICTFGNVGGQGSSLDLVHVTDSSGAWTVEAVALDLAFGEWAQGDDCSLAVDSDGSPRVLYYDWNRQTMEYATKSTGGWEIQNLGGANSNFNVKIMVDSRGGTHVIYVEGGYSGQLAHLTDSSGQWTVEDVPQISGSLEAASAMDDNDNIYVWGSTGLSTDKLGVWQHDDTYSELFRDLDPTSLAIDSSGALHAVFVGSGPIPQTTDTEDCEQCYLIYGTNARGPWEFAEIDKGKYNDRGSALALDRSGNVHLVYSDEQDDKVRYVTFNPDDLLSSPRP